MIIVRAQILRIKEKDKVPIVLIGNKCDLSSDREVSKEEGEKLSKTFACPFFESSAKLALSVEEGFYELVREVRKIGRTEDNPRLKRKSRDCKIL